MALCVRRIKALLIGISALLVATVFPIQTNAQLLPKSISQDTDLTNAPVDLSADEMSYDDKQKIVSATGNVEVIQGERTLLADDVTYYQNENKVIASGGVKLTEPGGSVLHADRVELKDNLKRGLVTHLRAKLPDDSLATASSAEKKNEHVTVLKDATFTPCKPCEDEPERAPLWRLRSNKATIDEANEKITYRDAFFEVKGVPVLYTPYFSHATPDASRKTGFLAPSYQSDSIFGLTINTPFYYNIAPDKDLLLSPTYTTNEGGILGGEFRHLLDNGEYSLAGSITNPNEVDDNGQPLPNNEIRGHIQGKGEFNINDIWSWGFDAKRASDDTYLKRYRISYEDVLTSRAYLQGIDGRNFASIEAISFQDLDEDDDPGLTPLISPDATMEWQSDADSYGGRWKVSGNALLLTRDEGVSSKRLSMKGGWYVPYITDSGHVFEFGASLRGDAYEVDNVVDPANSANTLDGPTGRVIPEVSAQWSLPLVRNDFARSYYIEPITRLTLSPHGGNPDDIPNEDSQDVEFSDANLFSDNRFKGTDLVESGPRVSYGGKLGVHDRTYGEVDALFGQSYRTKKQNDFTLNTGLNDNLSDYVGRIAYRMNENVSAAYHFRFDKDDFSIRRNSITTEADYKPITVSMDYLSLDEEFEGSQNQTGREQLLANATVELAKNWSLAFSSNRNLKENEWIRASSSLYYDSGCVGFSLAWRRDFTRDRDVESGSTVSFQVSLKNVGD